MPRASIRNSQYHFEPIPPDHEPKPGENPFPEANRLGTIEVGWSKYPAGHVEVASTDPVMGARLRAGIERILLKANVDQDVIQAVGDEFVQFWAGGFGVWVHLDRDGVNKLGHTLQRARDQGYGKDF